MWIITQTQKVFSNGYKGIVQYKSLVCHPHASLVVRTRSRRPFHSISTGQRILTFMFFSLSLSFGLCLEVRRCLAGACHSFSCERLRAPPAARTVFSESEKIAIADEWPNFVRNPSLGIPSSDSVKYARKYWVLNN